MFNRASIIENRAITLDSIKFGVFIMTVCIG